MSLRSFCCPVTGTRGAKGSMENVPQRPPQGSKAGNRKQVPNGLYSTLPFYKYTSRHISYYFIIHSRNVYRASIMVLNITKSQDSFPHGAQSRWDQPGWHRCSVGAGVTGVSLHMHRGWGTRGTLGIPVGGIGKGSRDRELEQESEKMW